MKFSKFGKAAPATTQTEAPLGMTPALAEVREIIGAMRDSASGLQEVVGSLKTAAAAFEEAIKSAKAPEQPPPVITEEGSSGSESPPEHSG